MNPNVRRELAEMDRLMVSDQIAALRQEVALLDEENGLLRGDVLWLTSRLDAAGLSYPLSSAGRRARASFNKPTKPQGAKP